MKIIKPLIILVVISLVLQTGLLLFLNNYYLGDEKKIVYKDVDVKKTKDDNEVTYNLPQNAVDFRTSFDGKYFTYYLDNVLNIVNTSTLGKNEVKMEATSVKSMCRWLDDRNRLVIAETQKNGDAYEVKFFSYDAKENSKVQTRNYVKDTEVTIQLASENSEINDIVFNTMNTIFYPKITDGAGKIKLYRVDISLPIETLNLKTFNIGKIGIIKNEDKLVYEDAVNSQVYIDKNQKSLGLKGQSGSCLLKVDDTGEIYTGLLNNGRVEDIYCGKSTEAEATWKHITLEKAINPEDIYIVSTEEIFINDKAKKTITNIVSSIKYSYEGTLLTNFDKGIFYIKNNSEVVKKEFVLN